MPTAGTRKAHSDPPGEEAVRETKRHLGWPEDKQFFVPEEALAAQRNAATDPMQQSFASLMLYCAKGDPIDMSQTMRQFPFRLKSIRDYAREVTATR